MRSGVQRIVGKDGQKIKKASRSSLVVLQILFIYAYTLLLGILAQHNFHEGTIVQSLNCSDVNLYFVRRRVASRFYQQISSFTSCVYPKRKQTNITKLKAIMICPQLLQPLYGLASDVNSDCEASVFDMVCATGTARLGVGLKGVLAVR